MRGKTKVHYSIDEEKILEKLRNGATVKELQDKAQKYLYRLASGGDDLYELDGDYEATLHAYVQACENASKKLKNEKKKN